MITWITKETTSIYWKLLGTYKVEIYCTLYSYMNCELNYKFS